jgi:hypothetical protein
MSEFVSDYKRKIAQLKEDGELPMMEGKSPMSNTGYNFLAFIESSDTRRGLQRVNIFAFFSTVVLEFDGKVSFCCKHKI